MNTCQDCDTDEGVLTCEDCGQGFCMDCFHVYSWQAHSYLCWKCQNVADKEWLAQFGWTVVRNPKPVRRRGRNVSEDGK